MDLYSGPNPATRGSLARQQTGPITDESGRVVQWCGINTDIDERRRSEEILHRELNLRLLVDSIPARLRS